MILTFCLLSLYLSVMTVLFDVVYFDVQCSCVRLWLSSYSHKQDLGYRNSLVEFANCYNSTAFILCF